MTTTPTTEHRGRKSSKTRLPGRHKPQPKHEASIADYFKNDEKVTNLLADDKTLALTVNQLDTFASKDHELETVGVTYGEALYNILALSLDAKRKVIFAIADEKNIPRPTFTEPKVKHRGRPDSGRKQLAEVLYNTWPEMLKLEGKNKDTRAGMRITDHVRRFKISAGLQEVRKTRSGGGVPKRTLRRSFGALWAVAKNKREAEMLTLLFERLGIEHKDLEAWEAEAKPAETAA